MLTVDDFNIGESVHLRIITKKLGAAKGFRIDDRTIEFPKDAPFMEHLLGWRKAVAERGGDKRLFPISVTMVHGIVKRTSGGRFCPYNFRHSRLTKLAAEGASMSELMYWKGARSMRSVEPYLAAKPIGRRLNIT